MERRSGQTDAHTASLLLGTVGRRYRLTSRSWERDRRGPLYALNRAGEAGEASHARPVVFFSSGFRYTVRPLPPDRVDANRDARSYLSDGSRSFRWSTSSGTGYGVNGLVSRKVRLSSGRSCEGSTSALRRTTNATSSTRADGSRWTSARARGFTKRDKTTSGFVRRYRSTRCSGVYLPPTRGWPTMYCPYSLAGADLYLETSSSTTSTPGRHLHVSGLHVGWLVRGRREHGISRSASSTSSYSNGNIFTQKRGGEDSAHLKRRATRSEPMR
jgi:hypothetical protein